jgi:hypothetical protein
MKGALAFLEVHFWKIEFSHSLPLQVKGHSIRFLLVVGVSPVARIWARALI